jgi:hypothetical protein
MGLSTLGEAMIRCNSGNRLEASFRQALMVVMPKLYLRRLARIMKPASDHKRKPQVVNNPGLCHAASMADPRRKTSAADHSSTAKSNKPFIHSAIVYCG